MGLVAGVIIGLLIAIFLLFEQKKQLKTELSDRLRDAFAPQITEIETFSQKADFEHFRDLSHYRQARQFLRVLLKSENFVSEIRKRQYEESFDGTVRGWRIPWKQEFGPDGKLAHEWGFIFRMEGPDTKMFPTCLIYYASNEIFDMEYLGNDHGLPTLEKAKTAIIEALKRGLPK